MVEIINTRLDLTTRTCPQTTATTTVFVDSFREIVRREGHQWSAGGRGKVRDGGGDEEELYSR